jgi:hypothetical protein
VSPSVKRRMVTAVGYRPRRGCDVVTGDAIIALSGFLELGYSRDSLEQDDDVAL